MTSEGECADMFGRLMPQGNHYVPGPDSCTLCVCVSGQPKWCKAVLCSPPQDCKSFRVGHTCCEFICLDDTLSKQPENSHDFGLRLIAGAVSAILLLSVILYVVHRLRRRKLHGRQNMQQSDDQRSLASIGYIEGSMAYIGNGCDDGQVNYPVWKPPGHYFPRGEAPPPYDEVVAQVRAESVNRALMDHSASFHRSFSVNHTSNLENLMRSEERGSRPGRQHLPGSSTCAHPAVHPAPQPSHHNTNIAEQQMAAKIIDNSSNPAVRTRHSILTTGNNGYAGSMKITSSLGTIATSREDTASCADAPPRTLPPGYPALYTNITHSAIGTGHRTIPRTSSAVGEEVVESMAAPRDTEEPRRPSEKTLGKLMMLFGKLQADEASATTLPLTVDKVDVYECSLRVDAAMRASHHRCTMTRTTTTANARIANLPQVQGTTWVNVGMAQKRRTKAR